MKRSSAFILKTSLLFCALCAPALVPSAAAAPQWDYVYLSTASTPDTYPYGAWNQELYLVATDTITPVNGRLYFNLKDSLFFYGRNAQADPRISGSDFTFEWRQEVLSPGIEFSMAMYYAEDPNKWIGLMYNEGYFILITDDIVVLLDTLPTGPHTYRLVRSDSQVELYVDGALTVTLPVGAYTVNKLELSGWGMEFAPYEAYWDHVAYTRGAYSPADLPSPTEVPAAGGSAITKRNTDAPLLTTTGALSDPLVSYVTDFGGNAASGVNLAFSISRYPLGATGQELTRTSGQTGADGLADVRLKLGNIPAEYDVKAECQSCATETNSVTFTCCGKLPNDHFSQGGVPAWSPNCYANNNCQVTPKATIGWRGCALTSLATLINYYSDNAYSGIPRTNPGTLNTYLRGLPGTQGYNARNDVNFDAIERYSSGHVSFVDRYDLGDYDRAGLLDTADGLIRSGIPLIFRVSGPHFILVIGKCGDNFIVADPAGGQEKIYNPNNSQERGFRGLRIFSRY